MHRVDVKITWFEQNIPSFGKLEFLYTLRSWFSTLSAEEILFSQRFTVESIVVVFCDGTCLLLSHIKIIFRSTWCPFVFRLLPSGLWARLLVQHTLFPLYFHCTAPQNSAEFSWHNTRSPNSTYTSLSIVFLRWSEVSNSSPKIPYCWRSSKGTV